MFLSIKILAIKIEVNKDVTIPINNVVAKPLIGPEPKINNTAPVRIWVTFASTIERIAPFQLYEAITASFKVFPERSSSLALSQIMIFASTAVPIVKTIPAIPGKVSTAPKLAKIPNKNNKLTANAILAYQPALP